MGRSLLGRVRVLSTLSGKFLDFQWFAERFFSIRDRSGSIVPFRMNALQRALLPDLIGADDVLKARKGGVSTLFELIALHRCLTRRNYRALILAHEYRSALELMDIVHVAYKHLPQELKPKLKVDTRAELQFEGINSSVRVHTARTADVARGGTIDFLHCSEIAFWDDPHRTLTGAAASLGDGAWTLRESTANGAGTYWHKEWVRGKNGQSGYKTHFFDWRVEPSYAVAKPDPIRDPEEFDPDGNRLSFQFSGRERELDLTEEQARWRRRQVKKFGSTYPQEYAEDDVTCFLTSGRSFFDNALVQRLWELLAAAEPVLDENPELGLKLFYQFTKRDWMQARFVIGADTAEGIADDTDPDDHGDYSAASIVEARTGLQAATVHGIWEPYEFAHVLAKVARQFTTPAGPPLLAVERNEYGHAVLNELHRHIRYPNLYWHEEFDQTRNKRIKKLGWRTNQATRPIMLSDLAKALKEGLLKVRDQDFLAECLTFTKNRAGRPEAQSGCFDDRVVANAVAWQMVQRPQMAPLVSANLP